jgi:hypothetical protein
MPLILQAGVHYILLGPAGKQEIYKLDHLKELRNTSILLLVVLVGVGNIEIRRSGKSMQSL